MTKSWLQFNTSILKPQLYSQYFHLKSTFCENNTLHNINSNAYHFVHSSWTQGCSDCISNRCNICVKLYIFIRVRTRVSARVSRNVMIKTLKQYTRTTKCMWELVSSQVHTIGTGMCYLFTMDTHHFQLQFVTDSDHNKSNIKARWKLF
jgi:hypothetical protein